MKKLTTHFLHSQGISIPKRSKRQAATFYSYRRLDAIDINIDCHCVGGPNYDDYDVVAIVVGLVRKRADNFLLSTRHDHVNYVEDWQEMKWNEKRKRKTNRKSFASAKAAKWKPNSDNENAKKRQETVNFILEFMR